MTDEIINYELNNNNLKDLSGTLDDIGQLISYLRDLSRQLVPLVDSLVPLSEMFGYATVLRSQTQGRGNFTMEPSHYVELPKARQDEITGGWNLYWK